MAEWFKAAVLPARGGSALSAWGGSALGGGGKTALRRAEYAVCLYFV